MSNQIVGNRQVFAKVVPSPAVTATIHLHPTAPLAERVLLPGDPGRALLLAQSLLDTPKMFNHNRGLWGYTGTAADGEPLTIQSTGMGGPSAAIVISELADLGARRLLRVGTCGALDPSLALGQILIATHALAADGTSRALGAGQLVPCRARTPGGVGKRRRRNRGCRHGRIDRPLLRQPWRPRTGMASGRRARGRDGDRHAVRAGRQPRACGRLPADRHGCSVPGASPDSRDGPTGGRAPDRRARRRRPLERYPAVCADGWRPRPSAARDLSSTASKR